ncbi:unnamed protein product, partial [Iphiclides podalirius]
MRSRPHHPVTVSIRPRPSMANIQASSSPQISSEQAPNASRSPSERPRESARVIPLQEMDSIVDADMAMLDNNRLHFYRRINSANNNRRSAVPRREEIETHEESEPASNAQIREMDSIVSAMEADVTTGCDFFTRSSESSEVPPATEQISNKNGENKDDITPSSSHDDSQPELESQNANAVSEREDAERAERERRKILIKLKFLNETLKEVEGNLDELLKDFKWRHFAAELASESRVRLIFNGHVLVDEGATLRACGLHDRAVVHCLVHPKRSGNQQHAVTDDADVAATHELITERVVQPERAWDLENILMTLVSVALTVVWFFRCEYSNMFTASASVALFGLTVFYSVAIFGLYLSDTFHFDRRPAPQPAANN